MLSKADLHIHTTCSDGRLEPLQVVDVAINTKLSAFPQQIMILLKATFKC